MHGLLKTTVGLLATLASTTMATAQPVEADSIETRGDGNNTTGSKLAEGWLYFCSDDNCKNDCSIWFSVDNPGCFNAPGGSYFYKGAETTHNLIVSPSGGCHCQNHCQANIAKAGCHKIDKAGGSFRVIADEGGCPKDNC